jgi:DNA-binding LytR/AlgR family response regulator
MVAENPTLRAPVTAVIAEDEVALREDLEAHLAALWPQLRVLASVDNGIEAMAGFENYQPDVMFLDIQMPGLTGIQVAQQISERCHIVFITAYDSYAVSAFEKGAVDYVLKPYEPDRLAQAIERVQKRIGSSPDISSLLRDIAAAIQPKSYLNWIKASNGNEVSLITVRDICFFRADAKYTTVVTATEEFIIRRSIKELAIELDPTYFWQIHRSTIVNLEAISSVSRSMAGETVLKLKARPDRLVVSEAHRHLFRHM